MAFSKNAAHNYRVALPSVDNAEHGLLKHPVKIKARLLPIPHQFLYPLHNTDTQRCISHANLQCSGAACKSERSVI